MNNKHSTIKTFLNENFTKSLFIKRLIYFFIGVIIVVIISWPVHNWAMNYNANNNSSAFIVIKIELNTGIAFSRLDNKVGFIYALQFILILVLIGVFIFLQKGCYLAFNSVAIGGALFNFIDRMCYKNPTSCDPQKNAVLDYFCFFGKSAVFNMPDVFILIGLIGLAIFVLIFSIIFTKKTSLNEINMTSKIFEQIKIIHEDDNILIINKPKNLLVHHDKYQQDNTLVDWLKIKYPNNDFIDKERLGIIHRLDKNTNGLMIIAKNQNVANALKQQIIDKKIIRKYLCIVHNDLKDDNIVINAPITRSKDDKLKMIVSNEPNALEALTKIKVLEHYKNAAYIECELSTGRTHQIRVHLNYIHHQVYNDPLYGQDDGYINYGQFLTSYFIEFTNPITNLVETYKINPDQTFNSLLEKLRSQ